MQVERSDAEGLGKTKEETAVPKKESTVLSKAVDRTLAQLNLNQKTPRKIKAKKVEGAAVTFTLVLHPGKDTEQKFTVTKVGKQDPIIIELLKKNFWEEAWEDFTNFFRTALEFFFSIGRRPEQQSLYQDYGELHQSLKAMREFVEKTGVSSSQIQQQSEEALNRAEQIRGALGSSDPEKEVRRLAQEWKTYPGKPILIPAGYRALDGSFIPVLLRFRKLQENLVMDFYCDATEGEKGTPVHSWTFQGQDQTADLSPFIEKALLPLIAKEGAQIAPTNESFTLFFNEKLKQWANRSADTKKEIPPSILPSPHVPYYNILHDIQVLAKQPPASSGLAKQAATSAGRTLKWLDHLMEKKTDSSSSSSSGQKEIMIEAEDQEPLNTNQRLSLLVFLSKKMIVHRMECAAAENSPFDQAKIYQECLDQLAHTKAKINGAAGLPLHSNLAMPQSLKSLQEQCERKWAALQNKMKKEERELRIEQLYQHHDVAFDLDFKSLEVTTTSLRDNSMEKVESIDPLTWKDHKQRLAQLLNKEKRLELSIHHAIETLKTELTALGVSSEVIEAIIHGDPSKEEFQIAVLQLEDVLGPWLSQLRRGKEAAIDSPLLLLTHLMACPYMLPEHPDTKYNDGRLVLWIRLLQDNHVNPGLFTGHHRAIQALIKLRLLLSDQKKEELALKAWKNQTKFLDHPLQPSTAPVSKEYRSALETLIEQKNPFEESLPIKGNDISLPLSSSSSSSIESEALSYGQELIREMENLIKQCDQLVEQAQATGVESKKALLLEAKDRAFEILKLLPPPDMEIVTGEGPLWDFLSPEEQQLLLNQLSQLEKLIWQSQMQTNAKEFSGQERFQILKMQALRHSFFRKSIEKAQENLGQVIVQAYARGDTEKTLIENYVEGIHAPTAFIEFSNNSKKVSKIDWRSLRFDRNPTALSDLKQLLSSINPNINYDEELGFLSFNDYHFSTKEAHFLLCYDLSLCLSADTALEEQRLALFHYAMREYTRGKNEYTHAIHFVREFDINEAKKYRPQATYSKADQYVEAISQSMIDYKKTQQLTSREPFLPICGNISSQAAPLDGRQYGSASEWEQYIAEKARTAPQTLPVDTLTQLIKIRVLPPETDSRIRNYGEHTALNALHFITQPENRDALKHPFVQQFLLETLEGSFILQQGIIYTPKEILLEIQKLQELQQTSLQRGHPEVATFVSHLLQTMQAQVLVTQENLAKQGFFSHFYTGGLPAVYGGLDSHFEEEAIFRAALKKEPDPDRPENSIYSFVKSPDTNLLQIFHPFLKTFEDVTAIEKALSNSPPMVPDGESIDQVKDPQAKEQLHYYTLRSLQRKSSPLLFEELFQALKSYRYLLKRQQSQSGSEKRTEFYAPLFAWIRTDALLQLNTFHQNEQKKIIQNLFQAEGKQISLKIVEQIAPGRYLCTDRSLQTHIFSFHIASLSTSVHIPEDLLQHPTLRQALHAKNVTAIRTNDPPLVIYTWIHQDQSFTLEVNDRQMTLKRTIGQNTYQFHPQTIPAPESSLELLLEEHGLWVDKNGQGAIFTSGLDAPLDSQIYLFEENPEQGKVLKQKSSERLVSVTPTVENLSPLPFALSKNLIYLANPKDAQVTSMKLKGSPLSLSYEEEKWVCYNGSSSIGMVNKPSPQQKRQLEQHFGKDWEEFIIPLKREGQNVYLLLPYNLKKDSSGKIAVDRETFPVDAVPLEITLDSSGHPQGSISANLYLADRFLHLAAQEKNSALALPLYQIANRYLHQVKGMRLKDASEITTLQHLIVRIQQFPVLAGKKMPSLIALTLNLRRSLLLQELRKQAKEIKELQPTPKEEFAENERIAKQLEAYRKLIEAHSESKQNPIHFKELFYLADDERAALALISQKALYALKKVITEASLKKYFDVDSVEASYQLSAPTHLDPQFLLALLRYAEPASVAKELEPPLTLENLLKNFWQYAQHIRKTHLSPEQLRFLFQPSQLPSSQDAKAQGHLESLDLQARQFLLFLATIEEKLHPGGKSLKETVEENVLKATQELGPLKELFQEEANIRLELLLQHVEKLTILEEQGHPDWQRFADDLALAQTLLINFMEEIEKVISQQKSQKQPTQILEEVLNTLRKSNQELSESIKEVFSIEAAEKADLALQKAFDEIKQVSLPAQPDFALPENKEAMELIQSFKRRTPTVGEAFSLFRVMSIPEMWTLYQQMGHTAELEKKARAFSVPLTALTHLSTLYQKPLQIAPPQKTMADQPLSTAALAKHPSFLRLFPKSEREEIKNSLKALAANEQTSLLQRLQEALDRNERTTLHLVGATASLDAVDKLYKSIVEKKSPRKVSELTPSTTPSIFQQYEPFFSKNGKRGAEEASEKHHKLCEDLEQILPSHSDSKYYQDLKQALENLKKNSPLPFSQVVEEDQLQTIETTLETQKEQLRTEIHQQESQILKQLHQIPVKKLPSEIQKVIALRGNGREILETCYKAHRNGVFAETDLDLLIANIEVKKTQLKILEEGKINATDSLASLKALKEERDHLREIMSPSQNDIEANSRLKATDLEWERHSNKLRDCLERCQVFDSSNVPKELQPHLRKLIYLQYRLGIVLRPKQLEALKEMVIHQSVLIPMRMGEGKTSTLLPFALEVLTAEGVNTIGITTPSLLKNTFEETDNAVRLIFELSGNIFSFTREDALSPLTTASLAKVGQKCQEFLQALAKGSYVMTTVESKASLDNKITEIEFSQKAVYDQVIALKKRQESLSLEEQAQLEILLVNLKEHEYGLRALYKVKEIFTLENTRIIIDEVDRVARSNHSVNYEQGKKFPPPKLFTKVISTIFDIIREEPELEELKNVLLQNQQISISPNQMNLYLKKIAEIWLKRNPISRLDEDDFYRWIQGGKLSKSNVEILQRNSRYREINTLRRALNSSLRLSLARHIGNRADYDPIHKAIGVPAVDTHVSPSTKFSDPLMQLCLSQMIAFYKPQGEAFIKMVAAFVLKQLEREESDIAKQAQKQFEELLTDENASLAKGLEGDKQWQIYLRLKIAEQLGPARLLDSSPESIERPIHTGLNGCNIIALTGTATLNAKYLLEQQDPKSMELVEQRGRETTAEVIYRLVSSLPEGINTPIDTYPVDSENALKEICKITEKENGYSGLIDQACSADKHSQGEKVEAMYNASKRPIVFLDAQKGKCVRDEEGVRALELLSKEEQRAIFAQAFFYYAPSAVRGTHFDIPTGSKLALWLSPSVDADSRDQAIYRARELGEGHQVEIFISETQKTQGITTVGDALQLHHNHTEALEGPEDLNAYRLYIRSFLEKGIERTKSALTLEKGKMQHKMEIRACFSEVQSKDEEALLQMIEQEASAGKTESTKKNLLALITQEERKTEMLVEKLSQISENNPFRKNALKELQESQNNLQTLRSDFDAIWEDLKNHFPSETLALTAPAGDAEAEVEQEQEQEQEEEQEIAAEISDRKARAFNSQAILQDFDKECFDSLPRVKHVSHFYPTDFTNFLLHNQNAVTAQFFENGDKCASLHILRELKTRNYGLPAMRLVVCVQEEKYRVAAVTASESTYLERTPWPVQAGISNGGFFTPLLGEDGTIELESSKNAPGMQGFHVINDKLKLDLLLTLAYVGITNFNKRDRLLLLNHLEELPEEEQGILLRSLEALV